MVKTAVVAAETKYQEINTVRIYFFLTQQDNADIPVSHLSYRCSDGGTQAPSICGSAILGTHLSNYYVYIHKPWGDYGRLGKEDCMG